MKILLGITAVISLVALAPVANAATIQIQYQVGTGPITTCSFPTPGPVTCLNVVGPPIRIVGLDSNSNGPGNSSLAVLTSSDVDLINNSTSSQTIQIQISEDGFTAPVGSNATLLSHIGGTVIIGALTSSLSFQSCVDPGNNLRSVGSLGVACPVGTIASGLSAPSITATGSFSNDKSVTVASLSGPYSIQQSMVITLAAGAEINWSASSTVSAQAPTTTPEPASAFLFLGTGLIGLGAFGRKRLFRK